MITTMGTDMVGMVAASGDTDIMEKLRVMAMVSFINEKVFMYISYPCTILGHGDHHGGKKNEDHHHGGHHHGEKHDDHHHGGHHHEEKHEDHHHDENAKHGHHDHDVGPTPAKKGKYEQTT